MKALAGSVLLIVGFGLFGLGLAALLDSRDSNRAAEITQDPTSLPLSPTSLSSQSTPSAFTQATLPPESLAFFESKIRPVLVEHCESCHSHKAEKVKGELYLDSRKGLLRGGNSGPAVVPHQPDASLIIQAVRYRDPDLAMPPKKSGGKLSDSIIADLEQWVRMGAPDPRTEASPVHTAYDPEKAKSWWAYQPRTQPTVPSPSLQDWSWSEVDRFVLAAMESRGLHPVQDADRASLLRRVHLDLTGLPPSPRQISDFVVSKDPKAFEKVVDSLLDSPHFGERWGRRWLDVARYAETTGKDVNMTLPEAWRYRDYVIRSFNSDKPFNTFIREQIAGDLLPASHAEDRAQKWIATGFLAVGPKGLNESDPRQFALDLADEQIDATTQAFLGMTVSCARCHDHKFDPITQRDYTALAGIFLSTDTRYGTPGGVRGRNASKLIDASPVSGLRATGKAMDPQEWQRLNSQLQATLSRRDAALAARRRGDEAANGMSGFDIVRMMTRANQLETQLSAYQSDGSPKARILGTMDKPASIEPAARASNRRLIGGPNSQGGMDRGFETITDSPFLVRGDAAREEGKVPRGLPGFLAGESRQAIPPQSSGRLQLADWIASPENPLTARVAVNRIWQGLFGRGLVESVDNFGASGTPPSHPELLDHLANRFVNEGWSFKKLIRGLVTSHVYQLASQFDASNHGIDPDNHLFWRSPTRRLDAETLRDSMLVASGRIDLSPPFGSMVALAGDGPVGGDRMQVLTEEALATAEGRHRSVYLPVARNVQPEMLATFDFPDPSSVLGSRDSTLVPPQSLFLLNSDFVQEQASSLARRVLRETGFNERFTLACHLTWCRDPYPEELNAAALLDRGNLESWTSICRALLASADFLFLN